VIDQDLAAIKAALEAGPTPAELAPTLKDGDKFTVAGLRRRPDGTYTKRCKPGNETVFTAREAKPPAAALCAACVTPIVCTRDQRCMTAAIRGQAGTGMLVMVQFEPSKVTSRRFFACESRRSADFVRPYSYAMKLHAFSATV
jgi:hypothetical protein